MVRGFETLTGVTGFNHRTKVCVIPVLFPWSAPVEICLWAVASVADEANVVIPFDGEQAQLFPVEIAASTGQGS